MDDVTTEKPWTMRHSPMQIHWALVHYWSADPEAELGTQHYCSDAGLSVREWLFEEGLIDRKEGKATDRLRTFVEYLCRQPLPEQVWITPSSEGRG